ncbi:MAG TPA: hypothetical protein VG125_18395 [Pirellulales bacterium]|nr:hypothetical protein [Pirellulales bacterium]
MRKRLFLVAVLACLLSAAQNVSAKQYQQESPASDDQENVAPSPESSPDAGTNAGGPRVVTESAPYTPYPAGLSWRPTPQAVRVPIPDRIYYPPAHYVRHCPYFPRGYYWGANWRFNVIGCDNLLFCGSYRYNPYLTAAKARHDPKLRGQRRYAMPPGPEGQARLLGASPTPPPALPPTVAKATEAPDVGDSDAGEAETQVASDDASDKPATRATSSRRTARKTDRDLR